MTKKIVSILLVFALSLCFFAGSAFAVAGDASGSFADFPFVYHGDGPVFLSDPSYSAVSFGTYRNPYYYHGLVFVLPSPLTSGNISFSIYPFSSQSFTSFKVFFHNSSGVSLGSADASSLPFSSSIPSGTQFVRIWCYNSSSSMIVSQSSISYSSFVYSSGSGGSSGSGYDPSLDQDILSGIEAIARSLLDLETGPYSSTSGVSLNSDGVVTPTTRNDATLEILLNLIGVSSTYSSLAIEQMNLNFGNYFEYHEIEDTSSGTVTVVKNLPSYVSALGMELTDGINKLQRDNLMIYQQGEDLEDALYTDKTENQPWSVAQWLKDIYTAITSFFSSFWSPAETHLKTAAEDGMQAAADNGNAASGSQVDDVNSAADAFKSFGSTGNISSGDVMDIFSDGASYDFFSQTTKDNLAYHPPAGGHRNLLRSSAPVPADQSDEEFVDELDDKLCYWREVLGLP